MSVTCVGELLIDFVCTDTGVDLSQGANFIKKAGGAPANVAAAVAKLGGQAQLIGKVGNDPFGAFLRKQLEKVRVDISQVIVSPEYPTTMAFVSLEADGSRDFHFFAGADTQLRWEEIEWDRVLASRLLHFGSATALLDYPLYAAYRRLFAKAVENHRFVSFDPNYRHDLWKGNEGMFMERCRHFIRHADLVKVSDEELSLLTGKGLDEGISVLHDWGAKFVAVTLGKEGAMLSAGNRQATVASIPIQSIDSTGAGDAFIGALLCKISASSRQECPDFAILVGFARFANVAAALTCTKLGAIEAIPTLEEVQFYLEEE
ncbi:carbohydrate kinase family protein [Laceyella putida]|uniref:Carbohydrate kinase n=1 Tax=Laceyella putida TaxID=110101 RepID=A0ABW2RJJ8_9BACL